MFLSPGGAADAKRDFSGLWSDYRPFGAEENGARILSPGLSPWANNGRPFGAANSNTLETIMSRWKKKKGCVETTQPFGIFRMTPRGLEPRFLG